MTNYKAIRGYLKVAIIIMILDALCLIGIGVLNAESAERHSRYFNERWLLWGIGEDGHADPNSEEYSTTFYEMTSVIANISIDHEKICLEKRSLKRRFSEISKVFSDFPENSSGFHKFLISSLSNLPTDFITTILCGLGLLLSAVCIISLGCIWTKSREREYM